MQQVPTLSTTLAPGTVLADRFTLQRLAGRGGMASVFQAWDARTERFVALKLLHSEGHSEAAQRFAREAQLLSTFRHPGIVSHVAHGLTEDGMPFLAMEWLEGEDLAQRLIHQPLALSDALRLLRRVAEALAVAHARGIVHRDLKPSNLFLRGGHPEDAVLLDFGLARVIASQAFTGSAIVLGTPGYMAPEQASSKPDIAPSADVFSLGCVFYECLTGQPPFRAPHPAAVLAKILFSEPAPLRTLRPELPASLQPLMDRMLAKAPEQRLADARQLLHALEELESTPEVPPPAQAHAASTGLTHSEQHLVSVLLATSATATDQAPTLAPDEAERAHRRLEPLQRELQSQGARAMLLADGSLLATFVLDRGAATDQAALAAHCALSVKERWPEGLVVLTTGLSPRDRPLPVGEVVDRAGEFLHRIEKPPAPPPQQVLLDETTAGLLGPRFQYDKVLSGIFVLRGEHLSVDESRPLLGRPTPCVGREQELGLLEMAFASCVEDSAAHALLVTAPAGTGKSRLRHEFLRRLERRGSPSLVLLGRGDPMNVGSAYGLVGYALRRLCGVVEGEPPEARRQKLAQRVSRHLPPEQVKDTTEFLGELCAIPFPTEDSPKLRAAREDPQLMSTQVSRAVVSFLKAEAAQRPVLLMLEDLHWSDGPSVKLVDEVLHELAECPLLVLALARPEVKELFPGVWGRFLQELPLRGLSQKASARLVQEVLGPQLAENVVSRLVEQAAGNALFLEELIRGVAEGHGEETPGTVLAMLQSRLQRLEPSPRRVLLAASVFGRAFWTGGVKALLEGELSAEDLEHCLRHVTELEVVQLQPRSRFPGQAEYRFRHALVRDAAYSLVLDTLKPTGHRRAGAWLEEAGESDPLVLAEHYQRGGDKAKAAHFFIRAGERLFERRDLQGAQRCLKAAMACEPTGTTLTDARALESAIAFWTEDFARSYAVGLQVLPELRPGSASWGQVMGGLILAGAQSGQLADMARLGQLLLSTPPDADAISIYVESISYLSTMSTWSGQRAEASAVLARIDAVGAPVQARDGIARGWMRCTHGFFGHFLDARPWQSRAWAEEGVQAFIEVGSDRDQAAPRALLGLTLAALGEHTRAIEVMRLGLEGAQRVGQSYAITYSQMHLALVLSGCPEASHQEEARQLALRTLETEKVNLLHLGLAHLALARVAATRGPPAEAEARARQACEQLAVLLPYQLIARASLCAALRAQGHLPEARVEAEQGRQTLERMGGVGSEAVGTWLALAEVCFAQQDEAAADHALRQAFAALRLRAGDIPDPAARERFLSGVPENARTRELALQRWGEHLGGSLPS